ncbi:MAG: hypothetical protein IKR76_03990, partial [Ruminococcus sp.]|nr:hypothetical protein [Ruminococcus sp.]
FYERKDGNMNIIDISTNQMIINDKIKNFRNTIHQVCMTDSFIIVLYFDPGVDTDMNNICAYDFNGELLWRIEDQKPFLPPEATEQPYVGMHSRPDDRILVNDWMGRSYLVDILTGKILYRGETTK